MSQVSRKSKSRSRRSAQAGREKPLGRIRTDVAGIDIGATEIYIACNPLPDGSPNVRCFPTDTEALKEAARWMQSEGVASVAMESTGVYWIPLYEVLVERGVDVQLVDAYAVRNVPGRKTDVLDCQWLRELHACGLLRGCFLPDEFTAALRGLRRMRQTLRSSQQDWIRRMQKQLDLMNVRVHRAVSDITGVTGMAIVRAIMAGERDPATLASLRDRRCRKSVKQIERELTGNWREEHLQNLALALATYDHFATMVEQLDRHITDKLEAIRAVRHAAGKTVADCAEPLPCAAKAKRVVKRGEEPMRQALARTFGIDLTRLEGICSETASCVFMELGPDIPERFPSEQQFLSYLRLAPGLAISGGRPLPGKKSKRRHTRMPPLKRLLMNSASTLRRSNTTLGDYYRKLAFRKGAGVAVFATARKLAQRIYRAMKFGTDYVLEGERLWHETDRRRRLARLKRQASQLGMELAPVPDSQAS